MQTILEKVFVNHKRKTTYLKTADLKIGHIYKFKRMRANLNGQFGEQIILKFKKGLYGLPAALSKTIIKNYQGNPREYKKLIKDGVCTSKSMRIRLMSMQGKHKNSPVFDLLTKKPATNDPNEESSEEEDDDDEDMDPPSNNLLMNNTELGDSMLYVHDSPQPTVGEQWPELNSQWPNIDL